MTGKRRPTPKRRPRRKRNQQISEDDALAIALADHPEWKTQWVDGTLPDEIIGDDGEPMSPRLHIEFHVIVERQLSGNEPEGVVDVAEELKRLGVSRHDIRHAIGQALATQIWHITHEGRPFDERQYITELWQIVESYR